METSRIRAEIETYREAMDAFDEAGDDPMAKDYEYRDDDAVRFAAEAEPVLSRLLDWAESIRASLVTDKSNDWSEEIAALDAIFTVSQVGTVVADG